LKHIYVSPHADDVALSCGGQILANPDHRSDSLVLTVFTSEEDNSGEAAADQARFVDAIHADRDKEDEAAWSSIGVAWRALRLPEALLRGSFPFSIRRSPRDRQVMEQLGDIMAAYMRAYPDAQFYFPAGIGRHVDHLLCRDVALDLLRNQASARIAFYADAPYWWLRFLRIAQYDEMGLRAAPSDPATRLPAHGISLPQYLLRKDVPFPRGRKLFLAVYVGLLARAGRNPAADLKKFRPRIITTTVEADILTRKRDLIYRYSSQLPMLYGDAPDALLARYRDCFATEATIELTRHPD